MPSPKVIYNFSREAPSPVLREDGIEDPLLCFLQLFIVSNRDNTYYFANNNARHFAFNAEERFLPIYQFAGEDNKKITHLDDFAATFLVKCTLGQTISRYMVLIASEQKLLMMRPYLVYQVKSIVDCIRDDSGNGYIWSTTGSGKTLTSFKASTLLKDNPDIEKCLFVVDRKDLDRQTREEFNKFQEGCVEENTNTASLVRRLLSDDYADKVIVTTIQKLGIALDGTNKKNYKQQLQPLSNKRIVFICDECHRSQFGENHKAIKEFFPQSQLFGFTGTPIFEENASRVKIEDEQASRRTTVELFQKQLHAYTITHAIEDANVLRFHVDFPEFVPLNIACVFSPPAEGDKDVQQIQEDLPQEKEDNAVEPEKKKAALKSILADYNARYGSNHTLSEFDLYYQDVGRNILPSAPADISDLRFVHGTKTTLTPLGFDETRPIKANSVLFVCIGSTIGKVAQNSRDCAANQQINAVVPNSKHSNGFVYFALSYNAERIAKLAGRQAVFIINKSLFSSVKMAVPKLGEQERIADCLSSLDELILGLSNKLAALKTHKKGLMQQLFPSPEVVEA